MARLCLVALLALALSGLSGQVASAGSVPNKVSGKAVTVPSVPAGGTTGGGTAIGNPGTVDPGAGVVDPMGKFAKACPKYPDKYALCTPSTPAPIFVAPAAPQVLCPAATGTFEVPYSSAIGVGEITTLSLGFGVMGSLPPGLTLDPATGAIAGTPTTTGTYPFTVTATNSAELSGSASCSITVSFPACTMTSTTGCIVLRHVVLPGDSTYGTSGTLTLDGVISFRADWVGGCSGGPGTSSGFGSYTISGESAPSSGTFTITSSQGSNFISTQYPFGTTCRAAVSNGYLLIDVTGSFMDASSGAATPGDIAVNTSPWYSPGISAGIGDQFFHATSLAGVTISC